MPCIKCPKGKWRIGSGRCVYATKAECEKAQAAIHAQDKKKKSVDEEDG